MLRMALNSDWNVVLENSSASFCNPYAVLSNCLIKTGTDGIGAAGLCATNDTGACFVAPALGDWRSPGDVPRTHVMDVAVSGGGEMSVMKNGELFVSVTEGTSGIRKFRSSGSSRIEFSFAADDLENSYGEVKSLRIPFGTAISIR